MAKSEEWRRGFKLGGLSMFLLGLLCMSWLQGGKGTPDQSAIIGVQEATITALQSNLGKCQVVSKNNYDVGKNNYDVAIGAQEENRQLRELVSEYQAQIKKGQAPADLAAFLLKLLVR